MNDYMMTIVDKTLYVYNQTKLIQEITLTKDSHRCTGVIVNDNLYVRVESTVFVYKLTTSTTQPL